MRTALLLLATALLAGSGTARAQAANDRYEGAARLLSYSGVFKDNYTSTVLKPFAASHGDPVEFVDGESSASMLEQIRAQKDDPKLDLVIMDASSAAAACA